MSGINLACRSQRHTLPRLGMLTNPWLVGAVAASALLQLAVLTIPPLRPLFHASGEWTSNGMLIAGLALTPVVVVELGKLLLIKRFAKN